MSSANLEQVVVPTEAEQERVKSILRIWFERNQQPWDRNKILEVVYAPDNGFLVQYGDDIFGVSCTGVVTDY